MPLNPKTFLYTLDSASAVATITLNRPERLNALTFEVYAELRDTFRALDTEPGVRAVIITGTGRAFCSGGDVEDIIGLLFSRDAAGLLEFTRLTGDLILSIRQCRRPVVAALNGTVAGAGAVIAAASDIRIAARAPRCLPLLAGRPDRGRHGRGVAAPANRRPGACERAAHAG
jgi:enoyl-CoA hydratase/carnithine racemase